MLLLLLTSLLVLTTAQDDNTYLQYFSQRFYTQGGTPPPQVAPFPKLPIQRALQISVRTLTNGDEQAFVLSEDGEINIMSNTGIISATGIPATPPGSLLAATTEGVVVCSTRDCSWYDCDGDNVASKCNDGKSTHKFVHNLGGNHVAALATDLSDNSIWIGSEGNLLHVTTSGTFDVIPVQGNITSLAVKVDATTTATEQMQTTTTRVAVGTTLAVYYHLNATGTGFQRWVNAFGAVMDGYPTSLTFFNNEIWIGGEWCLNVVRRYFLLLLSLYNAL